MAREKASQMKYFVYDKILEKINSGEIGLNTYLSEKEIAEELGTSKTPVREAILMLEAAGVLTHVDNKGSLVPQLSLQDIVHISQIREGLEGVAARIACDKANKSALEEFVQSLEAFKDPMTKEEKIASYMIGRKIHDEIINCTSNQRLIKIIQNMSNALDQIMVSSRQGKQRAEITRAQHLQIAKAILDSQYDESEKYMRNHIRNVTNDAIESFKQSYL